ncbi:DUF3107 domain-containing protein [Actinomadura sediminis]|uniref:DUF3107 domain-containing protein n=1 Tax=Actinomadura sediminis TaxID=1038904 RepID=A0ABW3EMY8_9ACTN
MQVRIGVQSMPKELVVETAESADEIEKSLANALAVDNGVLVLRDRRAGRVLVPARSVGYLEIVDDEQRSVGFGT